MNNYLHGYIKRSGFNQGMALMAVIVLGLGIWGWVMTIKLDQIKITGAVNATVSDIEALTGLSAGERIFHIDTARLRSRVEQHAWVQTASISRLPTGTLRIGIVERSPVVLVLDPAGRQAFYLDRDGIRLPDEPTFLEHASAKQTSPGQMSTQRGRPYDVPILRGYTDGFDEIGETSNATVKEFLRVLADDRTGTADMISEVKLVKKGVELRLEPLGTHGAVPVMLGSSEFEEKFERLHAFWYQALLPGQDKEFGWIDLRYDSQIVVRAAAP